MKTDWSFYQVVHRFERTKNSFRNDSEPYFSEKEQNLRSLHKQLCNNHFRVPPIGIIVEVLNNAMFVFY